MTTDGDQYLPVQGLKSGNGASNSATTNKWWTQKIYYQQTTITNGRTLCLTTI